MKAAPFEYVRAESLDHACQVLAQHGDEAKLIAGGQSLVPMLAMRLLAPAWLVNIHGLSELQQIAIDRDQLVIGAAVRQCVADADPRLKSALPLLSRALHWVGHAATRNRGTVGGSLAHADPSAELALSAALLEASLSLRSERGTRQVSAGDFLIGPMMTCLEADECLVEVRFPIWQEARTGSAFEEISARHGDFAIVSAAAQFGVDQTGLCTRAALAIGGAGPSALAFNDLARRLVGTRLEDGLLRDLAQQVAAKVEPTSDLQASAAYRHHLAGVLAERALLSAKRDAGLSS